MAIGLVVLQGRHIRLEPLTLAHLDPLCEIAFDEEIWRWMPEKVHTKKELHDYVQRALEGQSQGNMLPFATVEMASGQVIGSTRFANIDRINRRVEIGWTWIGRPWRRTAVNTEAKFLMLRHAFESLGCIRVELKTDLLNERSRSAILRLGAKEEGTLRQHMMTDTGRIRDTVYYSIIDREWPEVGSRLEEKLKSLF